ncbi:MAG: TM2 domain-containing protein [Nitrosomonas sp.]|nr:TM2 domain-containing protein [Nitrosomonas sp.]MCW5606967.1 TM2 domain-containing protein [Nitrosomonas sp.]
MLSDSEVTEEEERIRKLVRQLPDDKRFVFFQEAEKRLKDPDTYATLNYLFIAGLHHFYLGNWLRGVTNLAIFLIGIVMLFTSMRIVGILLILTVSVIELYALFKSQIIVQAYNNAVMKKIYREITRSSDRR